MGEAGDVRSQARELFPGGVRLHVVARVDGDADERRDATRLVQAPVVLPRPVSIPSALTGYHQAVAPSVYDPARAAALLEQDGWRAGADGVRAKGGRRL